MGNFYTTKNKYRDKIKKVFETESCTYKINANKKDYVWFIYKPILSDEISGLYLYNVTERKDEFERLLIEDMLKILYGYMCLCNKSFTKAISQRVSMLKKSPRTFDENSIEKQKQRLCEIKNSAPSFVYDELVKINALTSLIYEEEQKLIGFINKYAEIVKEMRKNNDESIPSKLLLSFYGDLYEYNETLKSFLKHVDEQKRLIKTAEDFFSVIADKGNFSVYKKVAEEQINYEVNFDFYKECPLIQNIISKEFSEAIIDDYKKLVRNIKY